MRIAMIGQKGVPATYGGIERHVEELGARLVKLGHSVTVFTRPSYTDPHLREYRGMRLISLPTVNSKHLEAIVHSVLASFATWRGAYDVVHYHAIGPCLASPIARLRGRRVVATIHGQDWRRGKWGRGASAVLRLSEWMALRVPHVTISVSATLAERYRDESGRSVSYVPNGISADPGDDTAVLAEHGLADGGYVLFAGRLVPEKGAHYLVDAHHRCGTELRLVVAGDSSNSDGYVTDLRRNADADVIFTGYEYGARLAALFRHAALFVLPSDLEGLPIVLLEALTYGVPILASDIAPNVEILGERGRYFRAGDPGSLATELAACLRDLASLRECAQGLAETAARDYDWDRVAEATQALYLRDRGRTRG
jgi:glycosyltransferase involved in cell wall biosynthesis